MSTSYTIERVKIEQHHLPGMYMGRNVVHDSRNFAYPWQRQIREITSQLWPRRIPILDQAQTGSCTGNAETGDLGSDPLFTTLPAGMPELNEEFAQLTVYSGAEMIDGDGPFPPNDNGSSGPSAAQVVKNAGYISGYLHCFALTDVLDALEEYPLTIGANWYDSMDQPDSSGLVTISPSAQVRGGHEFLCRGKDTVKQLLHFDNSWGPDWGVQGSFSMSWATLDRLLHEQGDATVSLPLTVPKPVPVPVPPKNSAFKGPYRHTTPYQGLDTLADIAKHRATTVAHLVAVSGPAWNATDLELIGALKLPPGTPFYTSSP